VARWLGDHNHEPEVEYPVDRFAITVDLACPSLKLAIEVDGGCHTTWKQQDEGLPPGSPTPVSRMESHSQNE
jgi:hypothetical protein